MNKDELEKILHEKVESGKKISPVLQNARERISTVSEKECLPLLEERCFPEGELRAERNFQFHRKIARNKMINNC